MPRQHTIEETIQDTLPRGILIAALKEAGLVPVGWDACSIQITQKSAGDEIEFVTKRSYVPKN